MKRLSQPKKKKNSNAPVRKLIGVENRCVCVCQAFATDFIIIYFSVVIPASYLVYFSLSFGLFKSKFEEEYIYICSVNIDGVVSSNL